MPEKTPSEDKGSLDTVIARHRIASRWEKTIAITNELETQTDRGAAIIATADLEDALGELLKKQFRSDDPVVEEIFKMDHLLGSLSAKISVGYGLRLFEMDLFQDLTHIRKIRNRFAHSALINDSQHVPRPVTFQTEEIRNRCENLKYPDANPPIDTSNLTEVLAAWNADRPVPYKKATDPRERFVHTCAGLTIKFQTDARRGEDVFPGYPNYP